MKQPKQINPMNQVNQEGELRAGYEECEDDRPKGLIHEIRIKVTGPFRWHAVIPAGSQTGEPERSSGDQGVLMTGCRVKAAPTRPLSCIQ